MEEGVETIFRGRTQAAHLFPERTAFSAAGHSE